MKKTVLLSVVASTMIMAGGTIAPVEPTVEAKPEVASADVNSIADAFANGTVNGQIRAFYITRDRSGAVGDAQTDRDALAAGGHLKYETASFHGLSAGAAFYTTNAILGLNKSGDDERNPTLFGEDKKGYSILGEIYLNYKTGNTNIKVGRQKLNTPLAGADDARMLPNLFEAAVVSNTDIADTTLIGAHITKFAAGTFSNAYGSNALSLHSGYGLNNISGEFLNAGEYAVGQDTDGVTALAAIYSGIDGLKLQAWDYYAHDILNAVYLQADAKWNCLISDSVKPFASAQYITQSEVGDALGVDKVDSQYWGVKAGATIGGLTLSGAYSATGDSDGATNGGIISPWGGMPAFTQGMVTRHQFFADTTAVKGAASYNFKDLGLKATAYYAEYDVGRKAAVGTTENDVLNARSYTAKEAGFDFIYQASKELQLRFRGNFPTDFVPGLDWTEYRFIANYNF